MFRLIIILSLFLSILFLCSCSIEKNEHIAISNTVSLIKTPFFNKDIDSIEIVDYCYKLDERILNGYKIQKDIILNKKIKASDNFYDWNDKKNSWSITDNEIDFMIKSLSKQKKVFLNKEKFKNNNKKIVLVDFPYYEDNLIEDLDRQERIKKEKFVYFFSKPVFNKNKDVFFIQYKTILLPHVSNTLIFRKENNNWTKIAELSHSME